MKEKLPILVLVLASLAFALSAPALAAPEAGEPTVDKTSLLIRAKKHVFLAGDRSVWKWTPTIEFRVNGPIAAGSKLVVEYTLGGAPWLSCPCETKETTAQGWWSTEGGTDAEAVKAKATRQVGPVGFSILLKGAGEAKTLYTGKFRVKQAPPVNNLPQFREQTAFYVDYDWALPIGLLSYAQKVLDQEWETPNYSPVLFYAWFPGDEEKHGKPVGQIYFNGKMLCTTGAGGKGACESAWSVPAWEPSEHQWRCYRFYFETVLGSAKNDVTLGPEYHKVWQNPGEYEIRILWGGKTARVARFTMTATGLPDGGLGAQLSALNFLPFGKFGKQWSKSVRVYPMQVLDNAGLPYDKNAWKTDAFFGNPLQGFTAPQ